MKTKEGKKPSVPEIEVDEGLRKRVSDGPNEKEKKKKKKI